MYNNKLVILALTMVLPHMHWFAVSTKTEARLITEDAAAILLLSWWFCLCLALVYITSGVVM